MSPVELRAGSRDDAATVAKLITELGYPTSAEQMHERLAMFVHDANYHAVVAVVDARVVGFIGLRVDRGYEYDGVQGRIVALVVDESQRGRGIGRALVDAGEAWARERGAHKIMVNTAHHRARTHEFYRSIGYESTGVRFVQAL